MTEIVRHLQRLGLIEGAAEITLEKLSGGYWNTVHRAQGDDIDWVIKTLRPNNHTTLFPILPHHESAVLSLFEGLELAPDLGALPLVWLVLATETVGGRHFSSARTRINKLLRPIHAEDDGA